MLKLLAITAVVLLTPPGTPSGGFRWQRIITPPTAGALIPACVALDADTFANAAPALRDLRLFQDGSELPYVIEESYDERALASGVTPADDRSEYQASAATGFLPTLTAGVAGHFRGESVGAQPNERLDYHAGLFLPAHVPVERVRIEPAPDREEEIDIVAHTYQSLSPTMTETGKATIGPDRPSFPYTIGANLQQRAEVSVGISGAHLPPQRVILEMRRRSLCYEPRSAAPLTLYLGGGEGMAAKTYSLAGSFSTAIERPLATMGPLIPNPEEQGTAPMRNWHRAISLLMIVCSALLLVLTGRALLRHAFMRQPATLKKERRPRHA